MPEGQRVLQGMGTVITIWVQHETPEVILEEAAQRAAAFEQRFSANDPTSELMQINQQEGQGAIATAPELFELIALGKTHSLPKDSYLNIAIGPLVQEWRIGFQDAHLPTPEKIAELLPKTDPAKIVLDEALQTVGLAAGMKLDLGAVAKGYFADLLMAHFKQVGVTAALIDLGGNVVTYGDAPSHADGYWRIGIQNPFLPRGNFVAALKVRNQSVVTSGIYERTYQVAGKTYHHIFDRETGYPLESAIASVTILSDRSVDGEIWTTRLFGKEPQAILQELSPLEGITGLVITKQGELIYPQELARSIETPTAE